jgi:hypothetical protein
VGAWINDLQKRRLEKFFMFIHAGSLWGSVQPRQNRREAKAVGDAGIQARAGRVTGRLRIAARHGIELPPCAEEHEGEN